jgi:hypothetical protein
VRRRRSSRPCRAGRRPHLLAWAHSARLARGTQPRGEPCTVAAAAACRCQCQCHRRLQRRPGRARARRASPSGRRSLPDGRRPAVWAGSAQPRSGRWGWTRSLGCRRRGPPAVAAAAARRAWSGGYPPPAAWLCGSLFAHSERTKTRSGVSFIYIETIFLRGRARD